MPTFNNFDDLMKFIKQEVADSMQTDVAEVVKQVEQEMIQIDVYDVYNIVNGVHQEPYVHVRRKTYGGLQDTQNMKAEIVEVSNDNVVLSITNETRGDKQTSLYVAPLVEYGDMSGYGEYNYKTNRDGTAWQYLQARPFTADTIKELEASGKHVNALRESLIRKGFNVE